MNTDKNTSQDLDFNPSSSEFIVNPYPTLERLGQRKKIIYDSYLERWLILRFQEGNEILRDKRLSQDLRNADCETASGKLLGNMDANKLSMLFLDPPEHTRLRNRVSKAFSPSAVENYRLRITQITQELLDSISTSEFDLVGSLAAPLSTRVISEILGVNSNEWKEFKLLSDLDAKGFDQFLSDIEKNEVTAAQKKLEEYFKNLIDERKINPKQDLVSELLQPHLNETELTETEILVMCQLLLRAGTFSTADLISNGVLLLLQYPNELDKLLHKPSLVVNVVEEILRMDSPVLEAGRISTERRLVCGQEIIERQTIMVSLAAANHDPSITSNPKEFNVSRLDIQHLSFGAGIHFCLGAYLARLEAQIALYSLFEKFPKLKLSKSKPPIRRTIPSFRGLVSLYVERE